MTASADITTRGPSMARRWLRRGFLLWAVFALSWLANSVRTRGVDADTVRNSAATVVVDQSATFTFLPVSPKGKTALIFFCGSGIAAEAYAPLLRPMAEAGYPVVVVKLPWRFAPFESHRRAAVDRARAVIAAHPEVTQWVASGHSLGGALAARLAHTDARTLSALVLIGTTHPKEDDLSGLPIPVTKVYASNDGIAPPERTLANRGLLPATTTWVQIRGGNHSQFGRYGHQLFDGTATISREEQESLTRMALVEAIAGLRLDEVQPVELAALASVTRTLNGAQVRLVSDRELRTEKEEGELAAKLGVGVTKDSAILACTRQPTCGPTLPEGAILLSVSSRTIQGTSAEVIVQLLSRRTSPMRYRVRLERDGDEWKVISLSAVVG